MVNRNDTQRLVDLITECADVIRQNRNMGIGDDSIENVLHAQYAHMLIEAALARIPDAEVSEEQYAEIARRRTVIAILRAPDGGTDGNA